MIRTLRSLVWIATLASLLVAGTALAFEEFIVDVQGTSISVTFLVADPRAIENLTTATFVTREGFESTDAVEWQQHPTAPGYFWTVQTPEEGAETIDEIYFVDGIPIQWSFTGPWTVNAEENGIIRKPQLFLLLPYVSAN